MGFIKRGRGGGATPDANPSNGREEDWNMGPPDYKPSALTTRQRLVLLLPRLPLTLALSFFLKRQKQLICIVDKRYSIRRTLNVQTVLNQQKCTKAFLLSSRQEDLRILDFRKNSFFVFSSS